MISTKKPKRSARMSREAETRVRPLPQKYVDGARVFLEPKFDLSGSMQEIIDELRKPRPARRPSRPKRSDWSGVIKETMAIWIVLEAKGLTEGVAKASSKRRGLLWRKGSDPLRMLLRSMIRYGEGIHDQSARQHWAADARIIRALVNEKVPPAMLERHLEEHAKTLNDYAHGGEKRASQGKPGGAPLSSSMHKRRVVARKLGIPLQHLNRVIARWYLVHPFIAKATSNGRDQAGSSAFGRQKGDVEGVEVRAGDWWEE